MTLRAIVLWIGLVVCSIAAAGSAGATQIVEAEQAVFAWTPAAGPAAGYAVFVSRNGQGFAPLPEVLTPATTTRVTVGGSFGDTLVVRVHAFDRLLELGPPSPDSEPVRLTRPGSSISTQPPAAGSVSATVDDALLWQAGGSGALESWRLAGGSVVATESAGSVGADWTALARCDVDGDGEDDLVWETGAGDELVALLLRDHRPAGLIPIAPGLGAEDLPVRAADFDGDGQCDLLVQTAGDGTENLVANGGFESGPALGLASRIPSGSAQVPGWSVGGAGVDWVEGLWESAAGARSLELSAAARGSVSQTIATVPGLEYEVTFSLAGHPDGADRRKIVRVAAGSTSQDFEFLTFRRTYRSMGWVTHSLRFVASGPATTISFSAMAPEDAYGPVIDEVAVRAIAPPSGRYEIWSLAGGALRTRIPLPPPGDPSWRVLGAMDVDADGDSDLLWQDPANGATTIWRIEGGERVGQSLLGIAPAGATLLDGGHLGLGDGLDLLWAAPATGALTVWALDGAGTRIAAQVPLPPLPNVLEMRDLDGDGADDLLWRDPASGAALGSVTRGTGPMDTYLIGLPDSGWSLVVPAP